MNINPLKIPADKGMEERLRSIARLLNDKRLDGCYLSYVNAKQGDQVRISTSECDSHYMDVSLRVMREYGAKVVMEHILKGLGV